MSLKYQQVDNGFVCVDNNQQIAEIVWEKEGNIVDIVKTKVDDNYGGQGIAYHLVELCVNYVKDNNYQIKPTCSYVKHLLDGKMKDYQFLIAKGEGEC